MMLKSMLRRNMASSALARLAVARSSSLVNARFATTMTMREALGRAMEDEMKRDDDVFLLGEEVAKYDGAYKVSKGLLDKFGENRILDTPITEIGFTGIAVGAAQAGLKPIVEFMTWNFSLQAIDHIINSAAKAHYMSGGQVKVPIVFRGANGAPGAVGAQHSQCFAAWYGSCPGLKVLAPYDSEDALGLLRAAVRDPNPVVVLESEKLYGSSYEVSDEVLDPEYATPIGKAKVQREGTDVTIVTFARMVEESVKAAEQLADKGISVEVINLRTIRPLDRDAIIKSVKKTNHLVTVEEGWSQSGVGAEIHAIVNEEAFDYLDAPPIRVTGADVPMPYAWSLEEHATPAAEHIARAVERSVERNN
eukprot:TRINITY_DN66808_c5_g1_i1.p1 TRINITY_DN66808_c5_g1~~TRINITY_DN66808_c5_g1_i1.p1  ORF type:complete len:364 (-),score=196.94 TRINITY_DN66808_c5_g1_i1:82-1173(-)